MRFLMFGAAGIVVAYAAIVLVFFLFQRSMQYPAPKEYHSPEAMEIAGVEEVRLTAADGTKFLLWADLPEDPDTPVILYFHGNAEAVWNLGERIAMWREAGYGFAAMSYRGYPGSGGSPSEEALTADAQQAFDWLVEEGVPAERIIATGFSLGSGIATALAASRPVAGLSLGAPFTSAADIGRRLYPWLPVGPLMRDSWNSLERIALVDAPVALVHGTADSFIPIAMSRALYAAASEPKLFTEAPGETHVLAVEAGWPETREFFEAHLPPLARPAARLAAPD